MTPETFIAQALSGVRNAWIPILTDAWNKMPQRYRHEIAAEAEHLVPGIGLIFEPFRMVEPSAVTTIFVAESPYPQPSVANGQVFHPGEGPLWSAKGLSAHVNRYRSLATFLRMLLRADDIIQHGRRRGRDIARGLRERPVRTNLRKVETVDELFARLYSNGVLLLNATPILRSHVVRDVRAWQPFNLTVIQSVAKLAMAPLKVVLAGELAGGLEEDLEKMGVNAIVVAHPTSRWHRIERFVEHSDLHALFSGLEVIFHTTGDRNEGLHP